MGKESIMSNLGSLGGPSSWFGTSGSENGLSSNFSTTPWAPGAEPSDNFVSYLVSADKSSIESYVKGVTPLSGESLINQACSSIWDSLPFTGGFEIHDLWILAPIVLIWAVAMVLGSASDSKKSAGGSGERSSTARSATKPLQSYGPGYSKTEHPFHYRTGWKDAERSPLTGEFKEPTTGVEEYSPSEWEAYCVGFEERMEKDYEDCDVRETRVKELSRAFQAKALAVEARNELRHGPQGPFEAA